MKKLLLTIISCLLIISCSPKPQLILNIDIKKISFPDKEIQSSHSNTTKTDPEGIEEQTIENITFEVGLDFDSSLSQSVVEKKVITRIKTIIEQTTSGYDYSLYRQNEWRFYLLVWEQIKDGSFHPETDYNQNIDPKEKKRFKLPDKAITYQTINIYKDGKLVYGYPPSKSF